MLTHESLTPHGRRKPEWAKRARTLFLDTDLVRMIASSNTRDLGGLVAREAEEHLSRNLGATHDGAQADCTDCADVRLLARCVNGVAWCESHEAAEPPTWHYGRPTEVDLSTVAEGRNAATMPATVGLWMRETNEEGPFVELAVPTSTSGCADLVWLLPAEAIAVGQALVQAGLAALNVEGGAR